MVKEVITRKNYKTIGSGTSGAIQPKWQFNRKQIGKKQPVHWSYISSNTLSIFNVLDGNYLDIKILKVLPNRMEKVEKFISR